MNQEGLPMSIAVLFAGVVLGVLLIGAFIVAAILIAPAA
jgi:hypothetical protein